MEDLCNLPSRMQTHGYMKPKKLKPECRAWAAPLTALTSGRIVICRPGRRFPGVSFRDRMLRQLTRDHSLVWPLYESGILTKDDISRHPQKNLITRSIGTQPQVEPDLQNGAALEGDIFLLCSDGLTDVLSDQEILQILSNNGTNPQILSDLLVKAANSGGGPDNITTVVVYLAHKNPNSCSNYFSTRLECRRYHDDKSIICHICNEMPCGIFHSFSTPRAVLHPEVQGAMRARKSVRDNPLICRVLSLDLWPANICRLDLERPSRLDKNSTIARFAASSTGGAITFIFKARL